MVQECIHVYENGHKCGRIPRRGERLCAAHQAPRARHDAEESFNREMFAWVDRLDAMHPADLLDTLQGCLSAIQPLIERKSSRASRVAFTRATVAVTTVIDRLFANAPPLPGNQSAAPALSASEIDALYTRLLTKMNQEGLISEEAASAAALAASSLPSHR